MKNELKIVGKSSHKKKLLEFINKASKTNANILLLGETGVGKELAARMIHSNSERKYMPFIKVNCANLNENLLESELFGHKKGAYTGAINDKLGFIEEASGGFFFLDEIANISLYLQAKLLSVVEDKEIRRLGENKTKRIDVRFIFATNKDLLKLVKQDKFRLDMYYRISILTYVIVPLRERKEDILLLVKNIIEEVNEKNEKVKRITQQALNKLLDYSYPGNIRELENLIKRAHFLSDDSRIEAKHIEFDNFKNKEEMSTTEKLYRKIINEKKSFWDVVHKPFLKRELNRREVIKIIAMGLEQSKGNYKKLSYIFNCGQGEKNYKKFMGVLRTHKLNV